MANGSATATVLGGTTPYTYSWNSSTNSVSDLDEGVYTLTVTDAHGCQIDTDFTIIQPSEVTVSVNDISAETCVGSDGSAIANALGGTGNLTYAWSNESAGQSLSDVPFGDYEVVVSDGSGCSASAQLTIPYDCPDVLPTTQLVSNHCNQTDFALAEVLRCNAVEGAEMYLWNFSDVIGVTLEEAYTMGNNNTFMLSELDYLTYGDVFNVKLKTQKDGEWGEWGNTCSVAILETPPAISIIEADCTAEIVTLGYTIQAENNSGADEFEWMVNSESGSQNYYTYVQQITINEDMYIEPNSDFSIQLRARYGDVWSEYGDECFFNLQVIDNVESREESAEAQISIYPNPNLGNEFSINIENLIQGNNVLDIAVYDSNGRLVKVWSEELNGSTQISKTYSFDNKLSTGMYLVQVDSAGRMYQQKLIVK